MPETIFNPHKQVDDTVDKKRKVVFFMHSQGGIAGHLEQLCRLRHIPHEVIPVYKGKDLSQVKATHIVALGGDEELCQLNTALNENPWLKGELQFISDHIKEGRPVLGICFGAQLMAVALGIKVEHRGRQFGWTDVDVLDAIFFKDLNRHERVFEDHNDSFDLPHHARLLMTGKGDKIQCFVIDHAIGTQFHPEITAEMIKSWTGKDDLVNHPYLAGSRKVGEAIFNRFIEWS